MVYTQLTFPKLIQVLEHAKDHIKVEILATKERMVDNSRYLNKSRRSIYRSIKN
jgi:hypothetical protein